ncbi:MAG: hypothetical protein D6715_04870 [Calditrichaeota bacterium]|nr:MAG: hypothetical protein D6715_04870 [Calditrichota bacterium]
MSERFQKTFISAREFVESWDKEIYELTNLDFFIFLMMNHLGNQLEKHYFVREKQNSPFNLSFESIGTLCFNLGDSFEFFLEENCFGKCPFNCLLDLNGIVEPGRHEKEEFVRQRLNMIRLFASDPLIKEQCLRIDLMNYVILDSLVHFYCEEVGLEVDEEDVEILEMADFVESVMVEFIRNEGQTLLQRPFEPAMDYFEDLLASEEDYESHNSWSEGEEWSPEESDEIWQEQYESIEQTIDRFVNDYQFHSAKVLPTIATDIEFFKEFLIQYADVHDVYEINEDHFLEFLSYWLVQKFALEDEEQIQHVFRTMARFVNWLKQNYGLDYKQEYFRYYQMVKTEVPRVVRALNVYLKEYDLLQALLLMGKPEPQQISGFFEVRKLHSRVEKTLDLVDVHFFDQKTQVHLDSTAYLDLKPGDILHATLVQRGERWEVLEIQYIFPRAARPFVH